MNHIVGVDPGLTGGLAFIANDTLHDVVSMPVVSGEIQPRIVREILDLWAPDLVVIEEVHSMPKQGVASTFKFGKGFGILLGVIGGIGHPMERVRPQEWKKEFTLVGKDKDASRHKATELWPSMAVKWPRKADNGLTDAALIAEWGRRNR